MTTNTINTTTRTTTSVTARLLSTIKLDVLVQWRQRLYIIGVGLAVLIGLGFRQMADADALKTLLPVMFLLAVGGTTFIYIAGLIVFERSEHTLDAMFVSPLRLVEYLASKLISLTLLVLIEGTTLVLLAQGITPGGAYAPIVNWLLILGGTALMGAMLTLFGVILVVRFDAITDFLMPALVVAVPLQVPALYFAGLSDSPLWLVIPTSAPTMVIWGAWNGLEAWQLLYGVGYSLLVIAVAYVWASRAFTRHIIEKR